MVRFYYSLACRLDKNQSYESLQLISSLLQLPKEKATHNHGNVYVNNNFLGNTGDALSHEPQNDQPPDPEELSAFGYQERVC